jgi:hypothetical protein
MDHLRSIISNGCPPGASQMFMGWGHLHRGNEEQDSRLFRTYQSPGFERLNFFRDHSNRARTVVGPRIDRSPVRGTTLVYLYDEACNRNQQQHD